MNFKIMASELNYLNELLELDEESPILTTGKTKDIVRETLKGNSKYNMTSKLEKVQPSKTVVENNPNEDKLEYMMKDYEYKIHNKNNVFNLSSLAQEKKIKNLVATKKLLLAKLKTKRHDIELQNKMRVASKIMLEDLKNKKNKASIFDKLYSQRKKQKLDSRNKRGREKALLKKKVKKQIKKKQKLKNCFLKFNNFGSVSVGNFNKYIDITDWRMFIERQIADILDSKIIDIDQLSKNLIYSMEQLENNKIENNILSNLNKFEIKLEEFGPKHTEKTHAFERKHAIENVEKFKMTPNDKELEKKKELVSLFILNINRKGKNWKKSKMN